MGFGNSYIDIPFEKLDKWARGDKPEKVVAACGTIEDLIRACVENEFGHVVEPVCVDSESTDVSVLGQKIVQIFLTTRLAFPCSGVRDPDDELFRPYYIYIDTLIPDEMRRLIFATMRRTHLGYGALIRLVIYNYMISLCQRCSVLAMDEFRAAGMERLCIDRPSVLPH